jgi:guanine deaminase
MARLEMVRDGCIGVSSDGKIVFVGKTKEEGDTLMKQFSVGAHQVVDLGQRFLLPGFVDTHVHAPQYCFTGPSPVSPYLN